MRFDLPSAIRPKKPEWLKVTSIIAAVSLLLFAGVWFWRGWSAGDVFGLTFGSIAAGLMGLEALYALRRRLFVGPLKTGQRWLQFHVYGGTLAAIFVLIHSGFRWPHGTMGLLLLGLTLLTTITGLLGVFVQKTVPITLASSIATEAIYEKIPALIADIRTQADEAVKGASDVLVRFYGSHVQPALAGPAVSTAYLVDVRAGRDRHAADFESLSAVLGAEDRTRIDTLKTLVSRKLDLEAHYTWQTVLRLWLFAHVPAAMLLLALVVAHIAAVWRY